MMIFVSGVLLRGHGKVEQKNTICMHFYFV